MLCTPRRADGIDTCGACGTPECGGGDGGGGGGAEGGSGGWAPGAKDADTDRIKPCVTGAGGGM